MHPFRIVAISATFLVVALAAFPLASGQASAEDARGAEAAPHVVDRSDLVMMILAGKLDLSLGDRALSVGPGDAVEVLRGLPFQAKSLDAEPSGAYLVYTPAVPPIVGAP